MPTRPFTLSAARYLRADYSRRILQPRRSAFSVLNEKFRNLVLSFAPRAGGLSHSAVNPRLADGGEFPCPRFIHRELDEGGKPVADRRGQEDAGILQRAGGCAPRGHVPSKAVRFSAALIVADAGDEGERQRRRDADVNARNMDVMPFSIGTVPCRTSRDSR